MTDEGAAEGGKGEMKLIKESPVMKSRAQSMRKNATPEENKLWYQYLKTASVHWYRQCVIGPYIADFYCKAVKLIIEIDGSQHYEEETEAYDKKRTAYFESLGIEVIRFTNTDIKRRLRYVCDFIDSKVAERQQGMRRIK